MLIRHSAIYVVARLLPGAIGLGTTAALTRLLSPETYGEYGIALVIMTFGSTLMFDWLAVSFLRFYQARREDKRVVGTVIRLFLALMGVSAGAALCCWAAGLVPAEFASVAAAGLALTWANSWFELVARFEIADFKPVRYLLMNLGRSGLILAGAVGVAWLTRSAAWTAFGGAAGMLAGTLLGDVRKWRAAAAPFDSGFARQLLTFGAPLACSMAMNSCIFSVSRGLIALRGSDIELGYYTAAYVMVQSTLLSAGGGIASAGYSLAVRAVEGGDAAAARAQLAQNGAVLIAALAPIAAGMALTAPGIARLVVAPSLAAHVSPIMPWMAAGTFLWCVRSHHLDHAFQLGRAPGLQVRVTGLAAAISVSLSYVLIPREGAVGVAMALTAAMVVACVHAWHQGKRAYPIPLPVAAAARAALGCGAMAAVIEVMSSAGCASLAAQVCAGIVTYVAVCLATNTLDSRLVLRARLATWRGRGVALDAG